MQNDIAEYNKPVVRTGTRTKFEPDLPAPRKIEKKSKNASRKPTGKALIQTSSKHVEKYHLINNLAQARLALHLSRSPGCQGGSAENLIRPTGSGHGYFCG